MTAQNFKEVAKKPTTEQTSQQTAEPSTPPRPQQVKVCPPTPKPNKMRVFNPANHNPIATGIGRVLFPAPPAAQQAPAPVLPQAPAPTAPTILTRRRRTG